MDRLLSEPLCAPIEQDIKAGDAPAVLKFFQGANRKLFLAPEFGKKRNFFHVVAKRGDQVAEVRFGGWGGCGGQITSGQGQL
jgi:hypothetical protein